MLNKRTSHAFGKKVYLLGAGKDGTKYWLEAPSWDCGWYWGFGYVETYTRNDDPARSRDISSHGHWSGFVGQQHEYDFKLSKEVKTKWVSHINECPTLAQTVLSDGESWIISDLMRRFYALKETAEILHSGTAHLTSRGDHKTKNDEFLKWINEVELPAIFKAVTDILTPKASTEEDSIDRD